MKLPSQDTRTNLDVLRAAAINRKHNLERSVAEFANPVAEEKAPMPAFRLDVPPKSVLDHFSDTVRKHPWVGMAAALGAGLAVEAVTSMLPGKKTRSLVRFVRPAAKRFESALKDGFSSAVLPVGAAIIGKGIDTLLFNGHDQTRGQF